MQHASITFVQNVSHFPLNIQNRMQQLLTCYYSRVWILTMKVRICIGTRVMAKASSSFSDINGEITSSSREESTLFDSDCHSNLCDSDNHWLPPNVVSWAHTMENGLNKFWNKWSFIIYWSKGQRTHLNLLSIPHLWHVYSIIILFRWHFSYKSLTSL